MIKNFFVNFVIECFKEILNFDFLKIFSHKTAT